VGLKQYLFHWNPSHSREIKRSYLSPQSFSWLRSSVNPKLRSNEWKHAAMATAIFWRSFRTNKFTSAAQDGGGLINVLMTQNGPCLLKLKRNMICIN